MGKVEDGITRDLMRKLGDDVGATIRRIIDIAPEPHLPIAMSAGASAIAVVAFLLNTEPAPEPDPDCLLLAGLLLARTGIGDDDPIGAAYADFEVLKSAGRAHLVSRKGE
jgi:hypothetical protein